MDPPKEQDQQFHSLINNIISDGTPIVRREKSSFSQRSLEVRSSQKLRDSLNENQSMLSGSPIDRRHFGSYLEGGSSFTSVLGNDESKLAFSAFKSCLDMTEDMMTNDVTLIQDDPCMQIGNLFQDFLDIYHTYSGTHEVFDVLEGFEDICSNTANALLQIIQKCAPNQLRVKNMKDIFEVLQLEKCTWRIIRTLYKDRVEDEQMQEEDMLVDLGRRMSDKQLIDNLFLRNSYVRQCQIVIDWLEKNASDNYEFQYFDKLEYFSDQSVAWEHTLHDLTNPNIRYDRPTRDSLVTELDPDAPIRQKNHILNDNDKVNEERLLKYMFLYLRSGNLKKAQDLAEKFGHIWLAASMEGWRPFHDPNFDKEDLIEGFALEPVEGNKYRDIWKVACWRMSIEKQISQFQQAIYGALCGNLKVILPVCSSWEDYLWAYVRCSVDKLAEHELRENSQSGRTLDELPAEYWDKTLDLEQIFSELQASPSEVIKKEGQNCYHVIQKFVILNDIDGLIEVMFSWACSKPPVSPQLMRFMAHVVLFLKAIKRCTKEELCVSILRTYVDELIKQRKIPLVASYVSVLPKTHQIFAYAKFLEGINDAGDRQSCLQLAEDAGLDIPSITKTVVQNLREQVTNEQVDVLSATAETTEEDKTKINAIDWLVFDQAQRSEAMKQANALMRMFVVQGKQEAARQVFFKIPTDSIEIIKMPNLRGSDRRDADNDNAIKEYLCFKAYLEAYEAFNDWYNHFQNAKPKNPAPLPENAVFKEKIVHEHEMKEYELEMERWKSSVMALTKVTTDKLYNVLLFLNGGWMADRRTDCEIDELRQQQMKRLRGLCFPQTVLLLHKVLYSTGQYKESIQLADIIADDKTLLYKEFTKHQLQDLLLMFRESSLALLGQNLDPFGYPLQQNL